MTALTLVFALVAGLLSTLSPCVLPLLPIVLGAAVGEHRYGPAALALGLALSFVAIGLFLATAGYAIGLDQGLFRSAAAALLIGIGLVLVVPRANVAFATIAGPAGAWAEQRFGRFDSSGLAGQFFLGLLLGAVWSPCVGPTLGAASVLAAQGKDLAQVAIVMLLFGIGAALPLLVLGVLSRETLMRLRATLMETGRAGKLALGGLLIATGIFVLTGLDKELETALLQISPDWLTNLTTKY